MPELITRDGGPMSSVNFMRLIKRAISDGILDGCAITKSGSTINIAAGHIVACGALIETEAMALTVATSGELVLKIDTTAEQKVQFITRTPITLTKQDLTTGGTVYEMRLATYTYSSGSITSLSVGSGSSSSSSGNSSSSSSSGSSSTTSSKSGTLVDKVSSTVSSPTVNYSALYSAVKNGTALTVDLSFAAKLNSSGSSLGTGIKLMVYARINGGGWQSAVIKENNTSWRGSTLHSVNLNLSAESSGSSVTVDFYVTRSGSTYGGTAGTLGSASSPKSYTFNIN